MDAVVNTMKNTMKNTSGKMIRVATNQSEHKKSTLVKTMKDTSGKQRGISERQPARNLSVHSEITIDRIRCRAYALFCERNGRGGDHVSDWLQAEHELADAMNGDHRKSLRPPSRPARSVDIKSRGRAKQPVQSRKSNAHTAPMTEHKLVARCPN